MSLAREVMTISAMIITSATTPRININIHSLRFRSVSLEDDERAVAAGYHGVHHAGGHDHHPAGVDGHGLTVDEQIDPSVGDEHRFRVFVLRGMRFIELQDLEIHELPPW